jgi:phosphate starvation-inducible PhoH-like protein
MYIIKLAEKDELMGVLSFIKNRKKILVNDMGKSIYPKTFNQKGYVDAMETHDLVISVGPAGTGKTYLAVAQALLI